MKLLVSLVMAVVTLSGCSQHQAKTEPKAQLYATPECTDIKLVEPCPLLPNGQLDAKQCKARVRISCTKVGR